MRPYLILLLFFFLCTTPPVSARASGGGMDSGGGDNKDISTGSAWFLGDRAIRYCIDLAPGFGVSKAQARGDIERAFDTWSEYISRKRIFSATDRAEGITTSLNYQYSDLCDSDTDLVFYLGTNNSQVLQQKMYFENPTAFAHRESFDVDKGWSKGWVWVSPPNAVYPKANFPDWTLPERLHGTLLHEMGHVLGNGHVPGTIMEESLTSWMQFEPASERAKAVLTHVDDIKELYLCSYCAFNFDGVLSHGLNPQAVQDVFHRLIGRDPQGKIRTRFQYNESSYHLHVEDDLGKSDFAIQITDRGAEFELASDLFKVIRRKSETEVGGFYHSQVGQSMVAQISIQGKAETLLIDRNPSYWSPLVIYLLDNGKRIQLFTASLMGM